MARLRDVLMMPAATNDGMHQQRRGDHTGKELTDHGSPLPRRVEAHTLASLGIIKIDPRRVTT